MKDLRLVKKHIFWLLFICFLTACGKEQEEFVYEDFISTETEAVSETEDLLATEESYSGENNFSLEESTEKSDSKILTVRVLAHICGAVNQPGVYELSENERVCDLVEAAGGFQTDADSTFVNLAKKLTDGEQIYIPTKEEVQIMKQEGKAVSKISTDELLAGTNGTESFSGKVNINTAGPEELMTLSGIGESRAKSIIAFREENASFSKIEDIMKVPGIKEAAFGKIKNDICVD